MTPAHYILINKSDKNDFIVVPYSQIQHYPNYHYFLTTPFTYSDAHDVIDRWKADKSEANGQ